jgi:penicillin-binding protein-related factor A (putative recombinase)
MGRRSQRIGKRFEESIELEKHGLPVLFKVPTERTKAGKETKKRWLDFAGCTSGGRFLTFDAKWIGVTDRVQRSTLKPHQRAWADEALAAGGVVFVYVGAVNEEGQLGRYIVPWARLREVGSVMLAAWRVEGLSALTSSQDLLDAMEVSS